MNKSAQQPQTPVQERVNSQSAAAREHNQQTALTQLQKFVVKLNQNAMDYLKHSKHDLARDMLAKAENTLLTIEQSKDPAYKTSNASNLKTKLLSMTYKNFGELFKQ